MKKCHDLSGVLVSVALVGYLLNYQVNAPGYVFIHMPHFAIGCCAICRISTIVVSGHYDSINAFLW